MDLGSNRYELLFMDDDDDVGKNALDNNAIATKAKKSTKSTMATTTTTTGVMPAATATAVKTSKPINKKLTSNAEKENKPLNKNTINQQQQQQNDFKKLGVNKQQQQQNFTVANNNSNNNNNNNVSNRKRNATTAGHNTNNNKPQQQQQQNGLETREQRNNRRNLRENGATVDTGTGASQRRDRVENARNGQMRNRNNNHQNEGNNNNNSNNNNSNRKREFDRQSGNERGGIKAMDKRDGAGANNWGSVKEIIDDATKKQETDEAQNEKNVEKDVGDANESTTEQVPIEEETKELTLDEWKAKKGQRVKPTFNIRKAGEGEDTSQWKKMVALQSNKKKEHESEDELEFDPALYPQRVGRQQRVLDIQFNFNDGRRGGFGRRRGAPAGGQQRRDTREVVATTVATNSISNGERPVIDRPPRGAAGRGGAHEGGRRQHAPKVNDERQFPTLS